MKVKDITGPGITTKVGMDAADLGIVRWDADRQANAVMFGDNFTYAGLHGLWFSPSIVMYDDAFDVLGVPSVKYTTVAAPEPNIIQGNRSQLWPYNHDDPITGPPGTFSTVLPTDFIKIGDWWYVHVMVCRGLGNELWTEWQRSRDLVNWEWVSKRQPAEPKWTMLTFDLWDDIVIICGTGGLARNKPIWQWVCTPDKLTDWSAWVPVNQGLPVLAGQFGELCVRNVADQICLSYFDAAGYKMSARMSDKLSLWSSNWITAPEMTYTTGHETPQCYGGYITPNSTPDSMGFIVSQWNTATNDPYKAMLFTDPYSAGVVSPIRPPSRSTQAGSKKDV